VPRRAQSRGMTKQSRPLRFQCAGGMQRTKPLVKFVVTVSQALSRRVVVESHILAQWDRVGANTGSLNWRPATQRAVRAAPVVIELPLFDSRIQFEIPIVLVDPEFLQIRQLRSLDFAVQMWRARRDGAKFDEVSHQPVLHGFREELAAPIGLDSLDCEGHFLHDAFEKVQRVCAVSSRVNSQHSKSRAVVNRGVLIHRSRHLHRVELHSLPRCRARVALGRMYPTGFAQRRNLRIAQHPLNARDRKLDSMHQPQLDLDASSA
jgi:hypothetical protein